MPLSLCFAGMHRALQRASYPASQLSRSTCRLSARTADQARTSQDLSFQDETEQNGTRQSSAMAAE